MKNVEIILRALRVSVLFYFTTKALRPLSFTKGFLCVPSCSECLSVNFFNHIDIENT